MDRISKWCWQVAKTFTRAPLIDQLGGTKGIMMRKSYLIPATAIASMTLTWLLFAAIYKPGDQDYLVATTSNYFKTMSQAGYNASALYEDCHLDEPDDSDIQQGVSMFGLCKSENETKIFYYMIAMSPTASFVYSDLEEHTK